jgi:hypothetical protein
VVEYGCAPSGALRGEREHFRSERGERQMLGRDVGQRVQVGDQARVRLRVVLVVRALPVPDADPGQHPIGAGRQPPITGDHLLGRLDPHVQDRGRVDQLPGRGQDRFGEREIGAGRSQPDRAVPGLFELAGELTDLRVGQLVEVGLPRPETQPAK